MGTRIILSAIVLLLCYGAVVPEQGLRARRTLSSHPFSPDQVQAIVDRHNELRKQVEPPASNMQYMVWHEELANMAQSWAEECVWGHGQPIVPEQEYTVIGQNMKKSADLSLLQVVDLWFSENEFYNYTTMSCDEHKVCGHYTQVVAARSKDLGCGIAVCNDNGGDYKMIVCNYGPPGNYRNSRPYKEGVACSECPSPSWCYEGLCLPDCSERTTHDCECHIKCEHCGIRNSDNCTCSCTVGWSGEYCHEICDDHHSLCGEGWYSNWCVDERQNVLTGCPLMCGMCQELPHGTLEPSCCDGKICQNEGDLDATTCSCECTRDYTGDVCENVVTTPVMVPTTEKTEETGKLTEKPDVVKEATVKAQDAISASTMVHYSVTSILASITMAIVYLSL